MARYKRIAEELRDDIASGRYVPGEQLPTAPVLVKRFGVSATTLWRTYDVLQAEGLVERRHGQGVFVRKAPEQVTYLAGRCTADGDADAVTFVTTESVRASERVAGLMQIETGTELRQYGLFALRENHPYMSSHVYVPADLAAGLPPVTGKSPWGAEVSSHLAAAGVRLTDVTERISSRPPTDIEAVQLKTPPGTWVMEIAQVWTDEADRVVQGAHLVLPGDRITVEAVFSAMLTPCGGEAA